MVQSCIECVMGRWFLTVLHNELPGLCNQLTVFDSCRQFSMAVDGFRQLLMVVDGCRRFSTVLCKQATLAPTNNECFPLGLQGRYWAQNVHWPLQILCVNGHIN